MPSKLVFSLNGKWSGGSQIPDNLREIDDFSLWSKNFINTLKHLGKLYKKFIQNDGVLVGQEKASLVEELDNILGGIWVLRRYLTEDQARSFDSIESTYHFRSKIQIDEPTWSGEGWFSNNYIFTITNFKDWYNEILMKKVSLFFQMYAAALEDNIITPEERKELIQFVETIAFHILVIERVLLSLKIST